MSEIIKSSIEQYNLEEKRIYDLAISKTLKKSFEKGFYPKGIIIKQIDNGVFSCTNKLTGNLSLFLDNNGEIKYSIGYVKERGYIASGEAFEEMKVYEMKENGVYNMYRVVDYKILEDGRKMPILGNKIDKTSKEYYKIWVDMVFLADIDDIKTMVETKMKDNIEGMRLFMKHGAFKFEDLETFKDNGMIDEETYNYGLKELRKIVVSQCKDIRLIKKGRRIKESDIKKYLEKGYIDIELAKKCYEVLPKEMRDLSTKDGTD